MRFIPICFAILVSTMFSGCLNDTLDCLNERSFHWRNHFRAVSAWGGVKHCYSDVDHPGHFKSGFMAGYEAAAMGGAPCPPALPPRKYWSAHYANYEGQQKQVAWFNGFEHGVFAAESSGAGEGTKIITPVEAVPLCPQKAEHQVVGGDGQNPLNEAPSSQGGNKSGSGEKPPVVPPVPDYDTSTESLPAFQGAVEVNSDEADSVRFYIEDKTPTIKIGDSEKSFQPPIIKEESGDVSLTQGQSQQFSLVKNGKRTPQNPNPNDDLNAFFED